MAIMFELISPGMWALLLVLSVAMTVISALKPKAFVFPSLGVLFSFIALLTAALVGETLPDGTIVYHATMNTLAFIPGALLVVQALFMLVSISVYIAEGE